MPYALHNITEKLLDAAEDAVDLLNDVNTVNNITVQVQAIQDIADAVEDLEDEMMAPTASASQQMLIGHYLSSSQGLKDDFYDELSTLGDYPCNYRNIAISNGSIGGIDQGFELNDKLFEVDAVRNLLDFQFDMYATQGLYKYTTRLYPVYARYEGEIRLDPDGSWFTLYSTSSAEYTATVGGTPPCIEAAPGGFAPIPGIMFDAVDATGWYNANEFDVPSGRNTSFVPTFSALDYNTTDYFLDINSESDVYCNTPFDAFYAPISTNQMHVNVNNINSNWLFDQIVGQAEISTSSFNYSLADNGNNTATYLNVNTVVSGTGVLGVNISGSIDYANKVAVAVPHGNAETGTTISLKPPECDKGVDIAVIEGGKLQLGDASVNNTGHLTINSGSTLRIGNDVGSNATLDLQNGSKLTIEEGASLIIGEKSTINISSTSVLEIKGQLIIEEDAFFSFNGWGKVISPFKPNTPEKLNCSIHNLN